MSQDFLVYLQRVLKEKAKMESSIEELSVICSRYGIEKVEQLEVDTISGIYHTLIANREKTVEGNGLVALMKKSFQDRIKKDSETIVENYKNIPLEVQESVIRTMMTEYAKQNPKLDKFLHESNYAKIDAENTLASQKLLKQILIGLFALLALIFTSSLLDSFGNSTYRTKSGGVENVKY